VWCNRLVFQRCGEDAAGIDLGLAAVASAAREVETAGGAAAGGRPRYRRVNYYEGILEPLLDRNPHLRKAIRFYTGVTAERLLFDRPASPHPNHTYTVTGVECSPSTPKGSETHNYFAIHGKHVILCGGAVLTPALLLASGIGDIQQLHKLDITPLRSAPTNVWRGVGKNLRDHIILANAFLTLAPFSQPGRAVTSVRGWLALDITYARTPAPPDAGTIRSRVLLKVLDGSTSPTIIPDVVALAFRREYRFTPRHLCSFVNMCLRILSSLLATLLGFAFDTFPLRWILTVCTKQVLLALVNPESVGTVTLHRTRVRNASQNDDASTSTTTSNRLSDFNVRVDPAYLSNPRDFQRISLAWNALHRITPTWFQRTAELMPGPAYANNLRRYASDFALPYYHWSGTCAMVHTLDDGEEDDCVVDAELRVRGGVGNLYICDASVLPDHVSGPPALTLAGMGLVAADFFETLVAKKSV